MLPKRTGVELYLLATTLGHVLLAAAVGAHAEVHGRSPWRWAPIVLLTGVLGLLWYAKTAGSNPREAGARDDPEHDGRAERGAAADAGLEPSIPDDWLEDRPRHKRLADPNSLHLDLPDGTTLTGSERKAVVAVIERIEAARDDENGEGEDEGEVDTGSLIEDAFEEHDAGYDDPRVWWTGCVHPALEALPEVEPPADADDYRLEFDVREVHHDGPGTAVIVDDGERSGRFLIRDGRVEPESAEVLSEGGPRWARLAAERVSERREGTIASRSGHARAEDR